MNHRVVIAWRSHFDGVKSVALLRKPEVFGRVGLGLGIVKGPGSHLSRPFPVCFPWPGAVDRFSAHFQPCSHLAQDALDFFWDRTVRTRTDIEQEIPILDDDINYLMNDEFMRFESVVLNVAPRFVTYRRIRLPG